MFDPIQTRYDKAGPKVAEALKRRHFDAYYVSTPEEAAQKVLELIPEDHVVSWGGSVTVEQLGVKALLQQRGNPVIDRDTAKDPAEKTELMRQALLCDTFLMSANAISEDGQLFNIDGNGNRVAALCYGPKSVIVVAGMNKVAGTMDDAVARVRHCAAPANGQRFDIPTPCVATGLCGDCISPQSICAQMVTTRISRPAGRIKVILVGKNLGI